jgi:hypothetical protein
VDQLQSAGRAGTMPAGSRQPATGYWYVTCGGFLWEFVERRHAGPEQTYRNMLTIMDYQGSDARV